MITFNWYRNPNDSDSLRGDYPLGDAPLSVSGQISLAWDLPSQYTDASKLFPNTYILRYGTQSGGPYNNAVDMSGDTDPARLNRSITGLEDGQTYYCVIQTVDSEGYVSAQSGEVAIVASVPATATDPQTYTEVRQTDLPLTINTSGAYRIMENLDYDGSEAFLVSADDVTIFAASSDNITVTVSTTQSTSCIRTTGHISNFEVYGFQITEGGHLHASSTSHGHIYFNNAGNSIRGLKVHDMTLDAGYVDALMSSTSSAYGCISFTSPTGQGVAGEIYNNTFNLRGCKGGSGIRGVSVDNGGTNKNVIVYDNTFNCGDMPSAPNGYIRGIMNVDEAYGNTFNIQNIDVSGFGLVGIYQTTYTHGNTFNVTNAGATRCILTENDRADSVHLYNSLVINSIPGTGGTQTRLYRVRFGANGTVIGFSSQDGGDENGSIGMVDIYGTQVQYGDTRDTYVYHNNVINSAYGLMHVREQVENTYLWGNTTDASNQYGSYFRSISSGENANGVYFDGDSIRGAMGDVQFVSDGAFPALENAHFAGLGSLNIANNSPIENQQGTEYFVDGDGGLITHSNRNTGTKTPNTPTNLRAA